MKQTQNWMWMKKQREILRSHISQASIKSFSDHSWVEKAFAEDAAGSLGGCVWPPRSYTCSFCKREFRSAQALGGHMNVHRRDRAKLKQSLSLHHSEVLHHQNHNQNPLKSSDHKCPSEICALDCDIDHNSCPKASTTISSSRVSAFSTQENLSENTLASPYSSTSFAQEKLKGSASVEKIFLNILDSRLDYHQQEMGPREEASACIDHEADYVETNLSMGLNSVFCRDQTTGLCCDEAIISCKRTKTVAASTLPFWLLNDKYGLQKEGLDLELRLGDPPKVK